MKPLVLTESADEAVPIIIEDPRTFPFRPGERVLYREATEEEYARYRAYWESDDR